MESNKYLRSTLRDKTRFSASFPDVFNCDFCIITSGNLDQEIEVYNG